MRTVRDLAPTRRDTLRLGAGSLLGGIVGDGLWPTKARANGRSNPRGTARFAIVVEAAGAISHVDTFDFKEDAGTQADFDVREVRPGLYLPRRLFPHLSVMMDKVAIVRSFKSHEVVHFRGEYYTRAGRPLNPAQAAEIPPVGTVVASELHSQRRESDTFPTFVTCNLGSLALPSGLYHPQFSGLDIDAGAGADSVTASGEALRLLEERYRLLGDLERAVRRELGGRGPEMSAFRSFQEEAYHVLGDSRWPRALDMADSEKQRYGDNDVGRGCLLARNLVTADAGTRYVHVKHGGWDHHKRIYDHGANSNHYKHCNDLDRALAALMADLSATPSPRDASKTLFDETIIVVPTEFGRVPGALNLVGGRHHYNQVYIGLFAGGGVKGGRIIGRTDPAGERIVETGWGYSMQPKTENIVASVYSALGIDWLKEVTNTPSKRVYRLVDPLGATEPCIADEIAPLFA